MSNYFEEALESLNKQMKFQDYYGGTAANYIAERNWAANEFLEQHAQTIIKALSVASCCNLCGTDCGGKCYGSY